MENVPIMSYAVKYASSFYGPFREAAESAPQFGDRKTYQMDPANAREAMREATADLVEGADVLMVKPGLPYLDIIRTVRESFDLPRGRVPGQRRVRHGQGRGGQRLDRREGVMLESLTAIKRAGADLILTYFTEDFLKLKKCLSDAQTRPSCTPGRRTPRRAPAAAMRRKDACPQCDAIWRTASPRICSSWWPGR